MQALYRPFKSDNSSFREAKSSKRCVREKLKCYLKKHFTSDPIDEDPIQLHLIPKYLKDLQRIQVDGIKIGPPREDRIRNVIKTYDDRGREERNELYYQLSKCTSEFFSNTEFEKDYFN